MIIINLIVFLLITLIKSNLRDNKNFYYDENYNELYMNTKDYYDNNNTYNKYNFEFEHSLIATNEKDYKNHKLLYMQST